jgi:hypothetical protein
MKRGLLHSSRAFRSYFVQPHDSRAYNSLKCLVDVSSKSGTPCATGHDINAPRFAAEEYSHEEDRSRYQALQAG